MVMVSMMIMMNGCKDHGDSDIDGSDWW
jgi:hypothetical protein